MLVPTLLAKRISELENKFSDLEKEIEELKGEKKPAPDLELGGIYENAHLGKAVYCGRNIFGCHQFHKINSSNYYNYYDKDLKEWRKVD